MHLLSDMSDLTVLIISLLAAAVAAGLTYVITRLSYKKRLVELSAEKDAENAASLVEADKMLDKCRMESAELEKTIVALQARIDASEQRISDVKDNEAKTIAELKRSHEDSLAKQIEAVRASVTAETEKILRMREEELSKKAEKTFNDISGSLGRNIESMQKAFEENKKTQAETSAALKERFEGAVKSMEAQTRNIGDKADNLANALRGQNKMQGNWGEAHLENTLDIAGLRKDTDYFREVVFVDKNGNHIINQETGEGLRADCVLRVDPVQDIILDSKVSLTAYAEYMETPEDDKNAREAALKRHIRSIRDQVEILSRKDYARYYTQTGRQTLDYVLMYVPNHPALELAMDRDRSLWRDAYAKKVYIVSDQSLFLTLHLIFITKRNIEQIKNQEKIIAAAQDMIERVADFAKAHAKMGEKLGDAMQQYEFCDKKLRDSGQSITVSARKVESLGVGMSSKKTLPETIE